MEISKKENIIVMWVTWHFYEMPAFLFVVWKNYLAFGLNYFSVPLLLMTLFSPWKKYQWVYPRGFGFKKYFEVFISNIYSRFMGALVRIALIIAGIIAQIIIFALGALALITWVLLPLIILGLIFLLI